MDDMWGRGCSAAAEKLFPTALPPPPPIHNGVRSPLPLPRLHISLAGEVRQ